MLFIQINFTAGEILNLFKTFFFFFWLKIKNFSDKEEVTSTTTVQSTTLGRVTGIQNSTASVQTDL